MDISGLNAAYAEYSKQLDPASDKLKNKISGKAIESMETAVAATVYLSSLSRTIGVATAKAMKPIADVIGVYTAMSIVTSKRAIVIVCTPPIAVFKNATALFLSAHILSVLAKVIFSHFITAKITGTE